MNLQNLYQPPTTNTDLKNIPVRKNYLTQDELFSIIKRNSEQYSLPPDNIIKGICFFLVKKNFNLAKLDIQKILNFLQKLNIITKGIDFYKGNTFRYIYEGNNIDEALEEILANTNFWIDKFGIDFFRRYSENSKERKTLMTSDIDDDFYLSCKGGSGIGTFSLDFAIGIKDNRDFAKNVPSGEIWRTGIDTQQKNNGNNKKIVMRIIRTGGGSLKKTNESYEKKSEMYELFKKKYGINPQRALAFLAMYIGKDLNVNEIKAITLEGAKQKKLSLVQSSKVNFDYTHLFKSVGFSETNNPNWLSIGDPETGFFSALETSPDNLNGLRAYETTGLNKVIQAFRKLKSITIDGVSLPLTICINETKEEIEKAMITFKKIHNK